MPAGPWAGSIQDLSMITKQRNVLYSTNKTIRREDILQT
jgi:hypothetical protein